MLREKINVLFTRSRQSKTETILLRDSPFRNLSNTPRQLSSLLLKIIIHLRFIHSNNWTRYLRDLISYKSNNPTHLRNLNTQHSEIPPNNNPSFKMHSRTQWREKEKRKATINHHPTSPNNRTIRTIKSDTTFARLGTLIAAVWTKEAKVKNKKKPSAMRGATSFEGVFIHVCAIQSAEYVELPIGQSLAVHT